METYRLNGLRSVFVPGLTEHQTPDSLAIDLQSPDPTLEVYANVELVCGDLIIHIDIDVLDNVDEDSNR